MAALNETKVAAKVSTFVEDPIHLEVHDAAPIQAVALQNYRLVSIGMATSDVICLLLGMFLTHLALYEIVEIPGGYVWFVIGVPFLWLGVFLAYGLYEPQQLAPAEEFRRVIGATSVAVIGMAMAGVWAHAWVSRRWIGLFALTALVLEMLTRRAWRYKIGHLREDGYLSLRTLVVGTD
ncbi:MAG: hypothetical protein ACRDI3_08980, partial [Actinomycetota bacterium]